MIFKYYKNVYFWILTCFLLLTIYFLYSLIQKQEKFENTPIQLDGRNLFLYWVGKEYTLITILRSLIYLHSKNGKGYKVHLITDQNINGYVSYISPYFKELCPAHQADYVRVSVVCKYGGLWMDSDTIVLDSLDQMFDYIDTNDGFFIKENNEVIWNGVFGSKPNTPLMKKWLVDINKVLDDKQGKIEWSDIGSGIIDTIYKSEQNLYKNYIIFEGLNNVYPVNWNISVQEFIIKPYDNYKTIVREFQPFIVLVNSVYKYLENKTVTEILDAKYPLNYFINKSIKNSK